MIGIIDGDVLVHWAARATDTPEDAEHKFHELMEHAQVSSWASTFKLAIKGKGNYRKDIFPGYKGHRKPLDPELKLRLIAAHNLAVNDYSAVMANGQEADDQVRIWAEECIKNKEDFIVIGEDKDLKMIPGKHYNPKKDIIAHVTEDEADMNFHSQLLSGDSADAIKGLTRVGPITALKLLAETPMGERMEKVIEIWQEREPDTWYDNLDLTGKLIYIRKKPDEVWDLGDYTNEEEFTEEELEYVAHVPF